MVSATIIKIKAGSRSNFSAIVFIAIQRLMATRCLHILFIAVAIGHHWIMYKFDPSQRDNALRITGPTLIKRQRPRNKDGYVFAT